MNIQNLIIRLKQNQLEYLNKDNCEFYTLLEELESLIFKNDEITMFFHNYLLPFCVKTHDFSPTITFLERSFSTCNKASVSPTLVNAHPFRKPKNKIEFSFIQEEWTLEKNGNEIFTKPLNVCYKLLIKFNVTTRKIEHITCDRLT